MLEWRRIETVTRQLDLCEATDNETVVILHDGSLADLVDLFSICLDRLGCTTMAIELPLSADHHSVTAATFGADLVVDLTGTDHSALYRSQGARTLLVGLDSAADLDHVVAHPGLERRAERLEGTLVHGSTLYLATTGGELDVGLRGCTIEMELGLATEDGDVGRWPGSVVWLSPDPRLVEGVVVAMPGDLTIEARQPIASPIRIEIEEGHVAEIFGESRDADILRALLEHSTSEDAYLVRRLGVGLGLTRGSDRLGPFDPTRLARGRGADAAGALTLVFGDDDLTLVLLGATIAVDDEPLVLAGALVGSLVADVYEQAAARI